MMVVTFGTLGRGGSLPSNCHKVARTSVRCLSQAAFDFGTVNSGATGAAASHASALDTLVWAMS